MKLYYKSSEYEQSWLLHKMDSHNQAKTVAVIVAHPDDETLGSGGAILNGPSWHWFILSLCRGSDLDWALRFFQALRALLALMTDSNLRAKMGHVLRDQVVKRFDCRVVARQLVRIISERLGIK